MTDFRILADYSSLVALIVSFALAFLFALTPIWHLSLLAGIIGGYFCIEMKWGTLSSFLGVSIAWLVYILTQNAGQTLDQIGNIILGSGGMGTIVLVLIVLLGGLFGALGGSIGSGIRILKKEYS